jgi:hypothetical protein
MNFSKVRDSLSDPINCNLKEKDVLKCYNELDHKWLFKSRKYRKCLEFDEIYKHCLVFTNQNKLYKREEYRAENVQIDMYNKAIEANIINKRNSIDYLNGKMSEEEYLTKENPAAKKKLIEL